MNGRIAPQGIAGALKSIGPRSLQSALNSLFSRRAPLTDRQRILRGVYEENLALLGSACLPRVRRRQLRLKQSFLYASLFLFGIVLHGQYWNVWEPSASLSAPKSDLPGMPGRVPKPVPPGASEAQPTATPGELPPSDVSRPEAAPLVKNSEELKALARNGPVPLRRMLGLSISNVTLDAGHGGGDQGTVGKMGTREKDITLDIARRLKAHLAGSGLCRIHMTREDDSTVSLQQRLDSAREANADLFVSIHVNYLPGTKINAVETYYFGPSRDQSTLRLAAQENAGSEYGLSEFEHILEKLGEAMKLQESRKLAESIQSNLFRNSNRQNREVRDNGVKRAPFVVLLGLEVPSVLAEVSCLSNADEELQLKSEAHRENIAAYLAAGITSYIKGANENDSNR